MTDKQDQMLLEQSKPQGSIKVQNNQNQVNSQNNQNTDTQDQMTETNKLLTELTVKEHSQPISLSKEEAENQSQEKSKSSQISNNEIQISQTKYFIEINRNNIPFGKTTLFPGSIEQLDVSIGLKDDMIEDNPYLLRVIAKCKNQQFNDLDEYVFSVRSNQRYQYFEEVRFKIKKKQKAQVKVAVKIPPLKQNYLIEGILEIQLQNLDPVFLSIIAKCELPQIICIKNLYKADENTHVIKVPAKKNQMRMPPIPFKNLSNFNFTLQIEAISNISFQNKPYDIITQNVVNCQGNTQFFVNLQLKQNMSYQGLSPQKDTIRKILILKIKNSSVYFNFPLQITIFEGINSNGMS